MAKPQKNYAGMIFGRLTVIDYLEHRNGHAFWSCQCVCGKSKSVSSTNLKNGHTQSCGCLEAETFRSHRTTHGMSKSPEFQSWQRMLGRCKYAYRTNPNYKAHLYYLDRGIAVCERWANSFENFFADMGPKPTPKHSLDRIDNDKGYSPENCRWATAREQALNKRSATILNYKGERKNMSIWAEQLGITCLKLRRTIDRMGSEENAIDYLMRGCG